MYSVLNTLSEYTYYYISKTLIYTLLLLVFKIVESLQFILNVEFRIFLNASHSIFSKNTKTQIKLNPEIFWETADTLV